jgi:hypothetical protein
VDAARAHVSLRIFRVGKGYFSEEARVPGEPFGWAPGTRQATLRKEAPRAATVKDFYMDKYLVTMPCTTCSFATPGPVVDPGFGTTPVQPGRPARRGVSTRRRPVPPGCRTVGVKSAADGSRVERERAGRTGSSIPGAPVPEEGALATTTGREILGDLPRGQFRGRGKRVRPDDMAGNVWQWTSTPKDAGKIPVS